MAKIKKTSYTKCWQEVEQLELLMHCWEGFKAAQVLWKIVWPCLIILNIYLLYLTIQPLGTYPGEIQAYVHKRLVPEFS